MSAKEAALAKANEAIAARKAANPGKKKTVLDTSEISARYLEIQHSRCFNFGRIRVYDEKDINNPTVNVTSGWAGNYNDGDPNKDLQRKLTLDFGKAFLVGRIYFDQYQQGHSGKYYPNGAMVILKDQQGKVIPTQYLDGDKKLTQHGHTDLRYNLSLKPADYSQTMNELNAAKDDAINKVNERQNLAKEKSDAAIAETEKKVDEGKKASETRVKNKKYQAEQNALESQKKNKCKATNQIYNIQFKTMQTYCANMGNTAESQDARCQNLKQQKAPECFGNVSKRHNEKFYHFIINCIITILITILFVKWLN